MHSRKTVSTLAVSWLVALLASACSGAQPETIVVTEIVEGETVERVVTATPVAEELPPVTYWGYSDSDIPTTDPQLAEDVISVTYVENMFIQLTNYDLDTSEVVPEAATSWEISDDGLTYTFTVRTDIPWVKHNPVTGETTQEVDAEGNPRFLTAHDFAFGIRRACDPSIGSYYSGVVAPVLSGCSEVLQHEDPNNVPQELVDAIGVSAPADDTLVIELVFPASYFLSMTPMWTLSATPEWAIAEHGEDWVEAGNLVTNGRFVLHEWIHGVRRISWRNPLLPQDLTGSGNVEVWHIDVVPDVSTGYALWLNNEVEYSGIPTEELDAHLEQFPDETIQVADLAVFYISFAYDKAPFDNVNVRRAFNAAFDREAFVNSVYGGQGVAMKHFAPPGIFGAPPIDEVGVGFNPEYARERLAEAGYPDCEGFPPVTLIGYSGQATLSWIEFAQNGWSEVLGCAPDLIQIQQLTFADLLAATAASVPTADRPHMWTLGWGPDYADENNWVGDVLWCETDNRQKRPCNEIDDLIVEARQDPDPVRRAELYREIEERFFGEEGEIPIAPLWLRIAFRAKHTWLEFTPALFGGDQWYHFQIDQVAQLTARGEY